MRMHSHARLLGIFAAATAVFLATAFAAGAADFPNKPIQLIVQSSAGGGSDCALALALLSLPGIQGAYVLAEGTFCKFRQNIAWSRLRASERSGIEAGEASTPI